MRWVRAGRPRAARAAPASGYLPPQKACSAASWRNRPNESSSRRQAEACAWHGRALGRYSRCSLQPPCVGHLGEYVAARARQRDRCLPSRWPDGRGLPGRPLRCSPRAVVCHVRRLVCCLQPGGAAANRPVWCCSQGSGCKVRIRPHCARVQLFVRLRLRGGQTWRLARLCGQGGHHGKPKRGRAAEAG